MSSKGRQRRRSEAGAEVDEASYHRRRGRANGVRKVVGLSSGTSMDGVDAALVDLTGEAIELLCFRTYPYPHPLRAALRSCAEAGTVVEVALLDVAVGECLAEAALELLSEAGVDVADVDCIGSHGQTLIHLPRARAIGGVDVRATLQIGSPSVIAERTGVTTVADFRPRDMAAGGQGAPLVPVLDQRLYGHAEKGRAALNLGGIANLTALPPAARLEDVRAFDTGPGMVLLDAAARQRGISGGIDRGGVRASEGEVSTKLLELLADHPFYREEPPKSADTGDFLGAYAERCFREAADLQTSDLLRTLAELTAQTVADAVDHWVAPRQTVEQVVVSGGGVHNAALMRALEARLAPAELVDAGEIAPIPADAKEAVLFALLAALTIGDFPGNVPAATGAARPVVLGAVVPG